MRRPWYPDPKLQTWMAGERGPGEPQGRGASMGKGAACRVEGLGVTGSGLGIKVRFIVKGSGSNSRVAGEALRAARWQRWGGGADNLE